MYESCHSIKFLIQPTKSGQLFVFGFAVRCRLEQNSLKNFSSEFNDVKHLRQLSGCEKPVEESSMKIAQDYQLMLFLTVSSWRKGEKKSLQINGAHATKFSIQF